MIKACLFDLDGTLLPMDTKEFIQQYFRALTQYVAHLTPPEKLSAYIWKALEATVQSEDENMTNEQVFQREFLAQSGLKKEEIWPVFERFYKEEFPKLRKYAGFDPTAREVVVAALEQGYQVAVATNPLFPKIAQLERLRWANVDDLSISLVTTYETSYYCKPNPQYYLEVAQKIEVPPNACVMIGNDMQEDMVASTVGMKTFFVKTCAIDRGQPTYRVDGEGTLKDLLQHIQKQTGIFAK